ncbi:MAG: hypothetical protein ACR2QS_10685 [Woeseiaceae bacterium]
MLVTNQQVTLQKLRAKPVAVLAVLLLAALQLTNATHQFDHTANDLSEACSICVQLDRLDDVSVTDTDLAADTTPYTGHLSLALSFLPNARPLSAQPRAPPFS